MRRTVKQRARRERHSGCLATSGAPGWYSSVISAHNHRGSNEHVSHKFPLSSAPQHMTPADGILYKACHLRERSCEVMPLLLASTRYTALIEFKARWAGCDRRCIDALSLCDTGPRVLNLSPNMHTWSHRCLTSFVDVSPCQHTGAGSSAGTQIRPRLLREDVQGHPPGKQHLVQSTSKSSTPCTRWQTAVSNVQ